MSINFLSCCCPECGVEFGIPKAYEVHLRADEKLFWCLNGHELSLDSGRHENKAEEQFGKIRGENEMLQAQVHAKEHALKDVMEELKILRGIVKKRHSRSTGNDKAPEATI